MDKVLIGNRDINLIRIKTSLGYTAILKINPINFYLEINKDIDDNRLQFGIGIFNYRFGVALERVN